MTNFLMCDDKTDCPACGEPLVLHSAQEDYDCECSHCGAALTVMTEWHPEITATVKEPEESKPYKQLYAIPAQLLVSCTVYVEADTPEEALENALSTSGPCLDEHIHHVDLKNGELNELDVESAEIEDVKLVKEILPYLEFDFSDFDRTGKVGWKPTLDAVNKLAEEQ